MVVLGHSVSVLGFSSPLLKCSSPKTFGRAQWPWNGKVGSAVCGRVIGQGAKQRVGVACLFSQWRHLCWACELVLFKILINDLEESEKSDGKVCCCC